MRATGTQLICPWELLEDSKAAPPLSLAMFGAVKIDRKPLQYIEEASRMIHHTHQHRKPTSYYVTNDPGEEMQKESGIKSDPETPKTPFSGLIFKFVWFLI